MNRKLLIISTILFISVLMVRGQQTVKYNGPYNNGLGIPATATYSYYVNTSTKKQVKHGNFRYTVREKDQNSRYSESFSGTYEHGLKNGQWEYQINIKDFKKNSEEFYQTADIHLIGNYIKGVPDGNWSFTAVLSKRGKYTVGKDEKWDVSIPLKNISIDLKFKAGILTDTLKIVNKLGNSYLFIMNENGLLDGLSEFLINGQTSYTEYINGFEKSKRINDEPEKSNPYYTQYLNFTNKKNNSLSTDTLSYFTNSEHQISTILNENVFNNEYFLFDKIDGDKMLLDEKGYYHPYAFKGLKYIVLKNNIPSNELAYIQKIKSIHKEIQDKLDRCRMDIKKAKEKSELQKSETRLVMLLEESKRLICYTEYIQSTIILDEAVQQAVKKCGDLKVDPKGLSRETYLIKLYNKSSELKNQALVLKI